MTNESVYIIAFQIKRIKIKFKMKCNFQMSEGKVKPFASSRMEGIPVPCAEQEGGSASVERK